MAILNRKTGILSGKIGGEVYYKGNGRQIVKKAQGSYTRVNTPRWAMTKALFTELNSLWRELPDSIKNLWSVYAAKQGDVNDVERNESVTYKYCPIPSYPPRPKLVGARECFVGRNVCAARSGLSIPRLYPPAGVNIPGAPGIDAEYDHARGELAIRLAAPTIINAQKLEARKALIWINAMHNNRYVVCHIRLDTVDLPAEPRQIELRYKGIEQTGKGNNYEPIIFADVNYLRMHLGAQTLVTPNERTAPVVSIGAFMPFDLLNDIKYRELEELIKSGMLSNIGSIRFGERFYSRVERLKEQILEKQAVIISGEKY